MLKIIKIVLSNILRAFYQPFLFAAVLSVFVMFFIMYLDKYKGISVKYKIINSLKDWKSRFCSSMKFRRCFYLVYLIVMIAFKTLLSREVEVNPLANVIGVWGLYDNHGVFTTQVLENIMLFIPFTFFLFLFLETKSKKVAKLRYVITRAVVISFLSSFIIEFLQLVFHVGTWQLTDLCFNTAGGVIGGLIYWIIAKIRKV